MNPSLYVIGFLVITNLVSLFFWDRRARDVELLETKAAVYDAATEGYKVRMAQDSKDLKECQDNWRDAQKTQEAQRLALQSEKDALNKELDKWKDRWRNRSMECSTALEVLDTACKELEDY